MNIIRRLLVAAATLGVLLSGAAISGGAASASTTPVAYGTSLDSWHAHVKPAKIYFGNGGAPFITNLTWKSWGPGSAWGTGRLWIQKPCSGPSYTCSYSSRWTGVYLNTVRRHGTTKYYYRMAVEFFVSGKARWDVGYFYILRGATAPFWWFPAVWPYL